LKRKKRKTAQAEKEEIKNTGKRLEYMGKLKKYSQKNKK
jgi:hypothetical protein